MKSNSVLIPKLPSFRFLGTGNSMRSSHFELLLGRSTISSIVRERCSAIWNTMKDEHMKMPAKDEWKAISNQFEKRANFPHCVGAIDCKHILEAVGHRQ